MRSNIESQKTRREDDVLCYGTRIHQLLQRIRHILATSLVPGMYKKNTLYCWYQWIGSTLGLNSVYNSLWSSQELFFQATFSLIINATAETDPPMGRPVVQTQMFVYYRMTNLLITSRESIRGQKRVQSEAYSKFGIGRYRPLFWRRKLTPQAARPGSSSPEPYKSIRLIRRLIGIMLAEILHLRIWWKQASLYFLKMWIRSG